MLPWGRAFSRVWTLGLKRPSPTLGSRSFQLLALSCCSSRNLRVTSSIESCRRSQKPARSWKVGTGNAVGSCRGRRQRRGSQSGMSEPQPGPEKTHPHCQEAQLGRVGWKDWKTGRQESPGFSFLGTNTWSHLQAYTHTGSPTRHTHLIGSTPKGTHHALLTQPEELLNLLGQEKLCTAHSTADLLQDWGAEGDSRGMMPFLPQPPGSVPWLILTLLLPDIFYLCVSSCPLPISSSGS